MGFFGPKVTGNWAEDLGNGIGWLIKAAAVLIIVLIITVIVLSLFLIF